MGDLGYIATGYAATGAAVLGYRWLLHHRARRARVQISALTRRRTSQRHVR